MPDVVDVIHVAIEDVVDADADVDHMVIVYLHLVDVVELMVAMELMEVMAVMVMDAVVMVVSGNNQMKNKIFIFYI
jgi:hypothetical protein